MSALPDHVRNAILSRWAVFQILDDVAPMLAEVKQADVARAIRQHVISVTESAWRKGIEKPLVDFLQELHEQIVGHPSVTMALEMQAKEAGIVNELCQALESHFQALIRNPDPIERMFTSVLAATSDLYSHFGEQLPAVILENASLSLSYSEEPPENALLAGRASTHFDRTLATRSQVVLGLSVRELDSRTINALPYVLFHECVSHVAQGPWTAHRREHAEDSQFSEGWMDYIALLAHNAAMSGRAGWTGFSQNFHPLRQRRHTQAADELHNRRIHDSDSRDDAWAAPANGTDAAVWLQGLFGKLAFTKSHPEDSLFRLSLRLNSSALEDEDLQLFTQSIHKILQLESGGADLEPILVQYAVTGDLPTLVESTANLAEAIVVSGASAMSGQMVHGPSLLSARMAADPVNPVPASLLVARSILLTRVPSTAIPDRRRKLLRLARLATADAGQQYGYLAQQRKDLPPNLGRISEAVKFLLNLAEYEQDLMESRAPNLIVHRTEIVEGLARLSESIGMADPMLLWQVQLRSITSPFGEFLEDVVRDLRVTPVASWRPIVLIGDDEIDMDSHHPLPTLAEILRSRDIRFQPVVAHDWKERSRLADRLSSIYHSGVRSKPVYVLSIPRGKGVEWSSHLRDLTSTYAPEIEFVTVGSSEYWDDSADLVIRTSDSRDIGRVSLINLHISGDSQAANQRAEHVKDMLGLGIHH